jgi:hypothetical protein
MMDKDRMTAIRTKLATDVRKLVNEQIQGCPDGDEGMVVQACYEALAYELGFLDGAACMADASKAVRDMSFRECFRNGKQECLDSHACPEGDQCEGAKALRAELSPN